MKCTNSSLSILKVAASLATLGYFAAAEDEHIHGEAFNITTDTNGCPTVVYEFDPLVHKSLYRVGVYAAEGNANAEEMFHNTFHIYLTETVGKKFNPPIKFEDVAVTLSHAMDLGAKEEMDFIFGSAAVYSCMATQIPFGAEGLVTLINRREARGYTYDLDQYGGVMFVLKNNTDINRIEDFVDKTIGAGSITAMGGGQAQFYEMLQHGVNYIADPKQVVFTTEESKVVEGVLNGEFEIGFARTDQIERHLGLDGKALEDDTFKIINPQTHVLDNGKLFPFLSSTSLFPEWAVAALDHVDKHVAEEVQIALLALSEHAEALAYNKKLRCDTTPELAKLAQEAKTSGIYTGFRTSRNYMAVRTQQQAAGFLRIDDDTPYLHCMRGDTLYQDIDCPAHYYKVTEDEFNHSCENAGIPCKEGYSCFCKPCIKAYEVDVYQYFEDDANKNNVTSGSRDHGCGEMELCGSVEQTKTMTFHAKDNMKRENPKVTVEMHLDRVSVPIDALPVPGLAYTYAFQWENDQLGVAIMEIFFNDDQIPESPFRVQVTERNCEDDFPGQNMAANANGQCVCNHDTVRVGDTCVDNTAFAVAGSLIALVIVGILACFYIKYKNRKADEMWQVNIDELHFDDPVEVIGEGSFGVVLLAEYRGTKVAIKRAIKGKRKGSTRGSHGKKGSWANVGKRSTSGSSDADHDHRSVESNGVVSMEEATFDSDDLKENAKPGARTKTKLVDGSGPSGSRSGSVVANSEKMSQHFSLAFLTKDYGRGGGKWARFIPWLKKDDYKSRLHETILGSVTRSHTSVSMGQILCPWFNEKALLREEFESEMRVLSRLRHPCITTVMGAVVTHTHDPMLVMEYMEYGSLHDLLRNETMYLSGEIIMQVTRDIAQGLRYLHSSKPPILHGDLKAKNILIDSRFRAKICDFGLSTKRLNRISGTPYWLAPEYLRGETHYDSTCDMYSVGIMLYEIFSRKSPYEGEDYMQVMRGICNRRINKRPNIPATTPPKFAELMKKCWSADASFRPSARDLDMTLLEMSISDADPVEEEQARAKKRSGDMLYELFPRHVADAIKEGKKVEPESHELVTVIFSDIVHFTDISRTISPEKVCNMLDRLYVAFDYIAHKHQVFKVETIGDAYMGVTNLENNQDDTHVKRIAEFAVDMVNEAGKIMIDAEDPSRGFINIRVGFHSGPVVSNVIGTLNKRYGLFGDTVNTASRMESNSTANKILCSDRAAKLLHEQAPEIRIKKRGKIQVKGKGEMNVYWVADDLLNKNNGVMEKEKAHVSFDDDKMDGPEEL